MPHLTRITLFTLLASTTLSLQLHDAIDQHDYVWISDDKSQWIGYLPQCEYICTQKEQGEVCDTHPKVCCEKGECTQKYGLTVCNEPVKHFKCDRNNHMHYDNENYFLKQVPEIKPWLHPRNQHKLNQQKSR